MDTGTLTLSANGATESTSTPLSSFPVIRTRLGSVFAAAPTGQSSYFIDRFAAAAVPFPAIEISGEGSLIPNGDDNPAPADGPAFGTLPSGGIPVYQDFLVTNPGSAPLDVFDISLTGAGSAEFISAPLLSVLTVPPASEGGIIATIAGDGTNTVTGDGGDASAATLGDGVFSTVVDRGGNIYFIQQFDSAATNTIRRISVDGNTIDRFAGGGASVADGVPATDAELLTVSGLAIDGGGNLFISERSRNQVRRVDRETGAITTVVGTGVQGSTGDGGPGTAAQINEPEALAIDPFGNLLIAERSGSFIRRVDTMGTISTIAGNGNSADVSGDGGQALGAGIGMPTAIVSDPFGNLYFRNQAGDIRVIDAATGCINTVTTTGSLGLAVDGAGDLYFGSSPHTVAKLDVSSGTITTVVGTGTPGFSGDNGLAMAAQINVLADVAIDQSGRLLVSDSGNRRLRAVSSLGAPFVVAYAPLVSGAHDATVVVSNSDSAADPYTFAVSGQSEDGVLNLAITESAIIENGGTSAATVSRNIISDSELKVTLVSSEPSAATVPLTVTIPAGQPSTTFTVTAVDDAVRDGTQPATITATAIGYVPDNGSLDVTDDELTNFSIDDVTLAEGSGGGTTPFTFTISRDSDIGDETIEVFTNQDTATVGDDYSNVAEFTINFPAGGTLSLPVDIAVAADDLPEADETFTVNLAVAGPAVNFTDNQGLGTILNDDGIFETSVELAGTTLTVTDANGGNSDDTLTFTQSADNLRVTDPTNTLQGTGAGVVQVDANTVDVPLANFDTLVVDTAVGTDTVDISASLALGDGGLQVATGRASVSGGAAIALAGTGSAIFTLRDNFAIGGNSSIITADGDIAISANQDADPRELPRVFLGRRHSPYYWSRGHRRGGHGRQRCRHQRPQGDQPDQRHHHREHRHGNHLAKRHGRARDQQQPGFPSVGPRDD